MVKNSKTKIKILQYWEYCSIVTEVNKQISGREYRSRIPGPEIALSVDGDLVYKIALEIYKEKRDYLIDGLGTMGFIC